jgi:hypothetical protein
VGWLWFGVVVFVGRLVIDWRLASRSYCICGFVLAVSAALLLDMYPVVYQVLYYLYGVVNQSVTCLKALLFYGGGDKFDPLPI